MELRNEFVLKCAMCIMGYYRSIIPCTYWGLQNIQLPRGGDDAFKFCWHDWMREALKKLLAALSEDGTNGTGMVEHPMMPWWGIRCYHLAAVGSLMVPNTLKSLVEFPPYIVNQYPISELLPTRTNSTLALWEQQPIYLGMHHANAWSISLVGKCMEVPGFV